jgi:hypothetical protein
MQKKKALSLESLRCEYERLSRSLAGTGYISQGSVLDRSTLRHPRSGYQWTRKIAQKTITVALSPEQFRSLRKAIENRRTLQKTITKMEKISRQILFETLPDTRRRKPLPKKVLGTI